MDLSCGKYRGRCYLSYCYRGDIDEEIESGVGKNKKDKERRKDYVKEIDEIRSEILS